MDLKKAQEYIKALKNGEKFPKKNMFLIMFLLGALLFVIVLPTGSSAPTSEKGGLDENKRKEPPLRFLRPHSSICFGTPNRS